VATISHQACLTSPVAFWHVPDIEAKPAEVSAAGATVKEPVRDVGGGRLVATVTDPDATSSDCFRTDECNSPNQRGAAAGRRPRAETAKAAPPERRSHDEYRYGGALQWPRGTPQPRARRSPPRARFRATRSPRRFTAEERAAMKERARELRAGARGSKDTAAGEKAVLAKIAEMPVGSYCDAWARVSREPNQPRA
jgi:hypothetical protein